VPPLARVKRGFVDVGDGQIHYRHAAPAGSRGVPLLMLHYCPGSSKQIEDMIRRFARERVVFAPDYPGNGDSTPAPEGVEIDVAYLARTMLGAADALGIDKFDLLGMHTGARVATEIALTRPGRVRKLILEGFGFYTNAQTSELLAKHFPQKQPEYDGSHLAWAWSFIKDSKTWFPWHERKAANRLSIDLPSAQSLHDSVLEVLKTLGSYHQAYAAAVSYPMRERVPQLKVPTMLAFAKNESIFRQYDEAVKLLPGCVHAALPCGSIAKTGEAELDEAVETMSAFLRS
jgi:pimeloyl-ACP methyl ester carboxylesterase